MKKVIKLNKSKPKVTLPKNKLSKNKILLNYRSISKKKVTKLISDDKNNFRMKQTK